jgi:hypothetical protein
MLKNIFLVLIVLTAACAGPAEEREPDGPPQVVQAQPMYPSRAFTAEYGIPEKPQDRFTLKLVMTQIADRELRPRPVYTATMELPGPVSPGGPNLSARYHHDASWRVVRADWIPDEASPSWEWQGHVSPFGFGLADLSDNATMEVNVGTRSGTLYFNTSETAEGILVELNQRSNLWWSIFDAWLFEKGGVVPLAMHAGADSDVWYHRTSLVWGDGLNAIEAWPTLWPLHQASMQGNLMFPGEDRDWFGDGVTPRQVLYELVKHGTAKGMLSNGCVVRFGHEGVGKSGYDLHPLLQIRTHEFDIWIETSDSARNWTVWYERSYGGLERWDTYGSQDQSPTGGCVKLGPRAADAAYLMQLTQGLLSTEPGAIRLLTKSSGLGLLAMYADESQNHVTIDRVTGQLLSTKMTRDDLSRLDRGEVSLP